MLGHVCARLALLAPLLALAAAETEVADAGATKAAPNVTVTEASLCPPQRRSPCL